MKNIMSSFRRQSLIGGGCGLGASRAPPLPWGRNGDHKTYRGREYWLVLTSALALISLGVSFCLPFIHSNFRLDMPGWLPHRLASSIHQLAIDKGRIPIGHQYLIGIIRELFESEEFVLGWAITLFSFILPVIKVLILFFLSLTGRQLSPPIRHRFLAILHAIGRWSMADVFIVALCIVIFKAEGFHFQITAKAGMYFYAFSACLSTLSILSMTKLTSSHHG